MGEPARQRWPHKWRPDVRRLLGDGPICFDTMIITALVRTNKTQMLRECMGHRAKLPPRVVGELRGHAQSDPRISAGTPPNFGEAVRLTREEAQTAADFQRLWYGKEYIEQHPTKDRGEAECLAVSIHRRWPLLSQDNRAVSNGTKRNVPVYGLPELLMLFAAEGRCLPASAWKIYEAIAGENDALVAQGWQVNTDNAQLFASCSSVLTSATKTAP